MPASSPRAARGTYIYYRLAPDFAQRWGNLGSSLAGLVAIA